MKKQRKLFVTRSITERSAKLIDEIHKRHNPGNESKSKILEKALINYKNKSYGNNNRNSNKETVL